MRTLLRLALASVLCLSPLAAGVFSLRVAGGGGFSLGGDYSAGLSGLNERLRNVGSSVAGSHEPLNIGWEGEARLTYALGPVFSLSAAAGFRRLSVESGVSAVWDSPDWPNDSRERTRTSLSSVPIALFIGARLPLGKNLAVVLDAGLEQAWNRLEHESQYETSGFFEARENYSFRARQRSFGLRAGAGLEAALGRRLNLVAEVFGRWARPAAFTGSYDRRGELFGLPFVEAGEGHSPWIYEERESGRIFTLVSFGASAPLTALPGSGRRALFGMSGIGVRAGMRFSLD